MAFDPSVVGQKLIIVGGKQIESGGKLIQAAGKMREIAELLVEGGRVDRSMEKGEIGIRSTRDLLGPVAMACHSIAAAFSAVQVPNVEFQSKSIDIPVIGRQRFITGITVTSVRPFRAIGTSIEAVAEDLDHIRTSLKDIADAVRDVHADLPTIKANIQEGATEARSGGQNLSEGGTALKDAGTLIAAV